MTMIYPEIDRLVEKAGSKYMLVSAVSKRARQIKGGSPFLLDSFRSHKPVGKALEEFYFDKLHLESLRKAPNAESEIEDNL